MKVRINIEKNMSMGLEIPEGTEYKFMEMVLRNVRLLHRGSNYQFNLRDALMNPQAFVRFEDKKVTEQEITEDIEEVTEEPEEEHELFAVSSSKGPHVYKGFLYIKCKHCGAIKGFNAKKPLTGYACTECGEITELDDLEPLRVQCECGGDFRYMTNIDADMFDMACIRCGTPVTMMHNKKKHIYTTIKEQE